MLVEVVWWRIVDVLLLSFDDLSEGFGEDGVEIDIDASIGLVKISLMSNEYMKK